MSKHKVTIEWDKNADKSEEYSWKFENGTEIKGETSDTGERAETIDPEAAFVASLSSCHMLSFMALAAKEGFIVQSYHDSATGILARNKRGRIAVTRVLLQPTIVFEEFNIPDKKQTKGLHDMANRNCFIANSVSTEVRVEPILNND